MSARIVLFLGKRDGRREDLEACYALATDQSKAASDGDRHLLPWRVLVEEARAGSDRGEVQVVVVGSNETWDAWERELHEDAERADFADREALPIGFLQYHEGIFERGSGDRYWEFFERLRKVLGGEPCADLDGFKRVEDSPREPFSQPCEHVVVDITRGWRALPMVGSAALAFCRAADRRRRGADPSGAAPATGSARVGHRLFYAALEAKHPRTGVVPVWDLTQTVAAVELSDALDAFARHGIADDLADFFEQAELECAREIAAPMRRFADDLLLMRIPFLLQCSAPRLQRTLTKHLAALKAAFPPVARDLDDFAKQIERLAPGGAAIEPVSALGLRALAELAQRLWGTNRRAELFALLREGLLTAFTVVAVDGEIQQPQVDCTRQDQPGETGCPKSDRGARKGAASAFEAQRLEVDSCWSTWLQQMQSPKNKRLVETDHVKLKEDADSREAARRILEQLSRINRLRNDVAHFMVANPREEFELRACLQESLIEFKKLVEALSGGV